jgi:uncharacterized protein YeaO (DUF488 family)
MVTLKRVYEPAGPEDGLRVLVDRRWPWRLDRAKAAIDRWEKRLAPSLELSRWFGGRRARWAEFRAWYALDLAQHREELARLQAVAAERPVTLLFAARDRAHNGAAVLQEVMGCGTDPSMTATAISQAELLSFLNSLLADSRTAVSQAKAILQETAKLLLDIKSDEAYASAVLIQLIKSLGGRPDYGIELNDDATAGERLASRLTLFGQDRIRLVHELVSNLPRVADDRVRHRLQKLLIARVRYLRRLDGKSHLALAGPPGRC